MGPTTWGCENEIRTERITAIPLEVRCCCSDAVNNVIVNPPPIGKSQASCPLSTAPFPKVGGQG